VLPAEPPAFVTLVSSGGGRHTEPVTVIATAPVNNLPVANTDATTTAEDTPVNIPVLANDTDSDVNDVLVVTGVSAPRAGRRPSMPMHGDLHPCGELQRQRGFNYAISDGNGGTASSSVAVTVSAVNDAPVAGNDAATTSANTPVSLSVLTNDSDVDGGTLTVSAVTQPPTAR